MFAMQSRRRVGVAVAVGDARVAPSAVGLWVGKAPNVRRVGGTSTEERDLPRAPVIRVDPEVKAAEGK